MNFSSMRGRIVLFVWCFLITASYARSPESHPDTGRVTVIVAPIAGMVENGMAAFVARVAREAATHPSPLLVLEMDTYGGQVDAAFQIVDTLLNYSAGTTVAFVKNKAISAGALIALSCNTLVMKHNTTIGDCAPILQSEEGPKILGEKIQSPLRAKFRTLAKRNGYPEALAEAMVTPELTVYKIVVNDSTRYLDSVAFAELPDTVKKTVAEKTTIVANGELLTMDNAEACTLGFSAMSVGSIDEMLATMRITNYRILRVEENWSERLVRLLTEFAPILIMIGLAGIYIEVRSPGFGLPGIVGGACLALVFFGQYMVGLADYTELLIISLGAILLTIELFVIPGFGIFGFAGLAILAVGMILSLQGFVLPAPSLPWQKTLFVSNVVKVMISLVGAVVCTLLFFRFAFPRLSRRISGPYLSSTLYEAQAIMRSARQATVGQAGVAITDLKPAGKARIGAVDCDVVTTGEYITCGTPVIVEEITGNRVIVARSPVDG
jgi:membrane-bound serine protease (ClpP class)